MEIIARQVSLLSFRNAQENYSRSASSTSIFHLFYIENHRNYFFFFFFRESRFFLLTYIPSYIFLHVIPRRRYSSLVAGTFSMACTTEYFIRKHSWPDIAVTLAETSTLLWTPFYGEWIVYFQARNRERSRAAPVSILAFRLVPYFATLLVQRSV